MKNASDVFDVEFTEAEIDQLLSDEEWQENVAEACFVSALYSSKLNKKPEDIIEEVAVYNVTNRLREFFLAKSQPLPKEVTWMRDNTFLDAFCYVENYVCRVMMMKDANQLKESVTLRINIQEENLVEELKVWCEKFNDMYPEIHVSYRIDNNVDELFSVYLTVV